MTLSLRDIVAAQNAIRGIAHRTPLEHTSTFSELTGGEVYLKLENLQRTGAFKVRGAIAKMTALSQEERDKGVVAASAGNHAQGVALAAYLLGISATIVMPRYAPVSKVAATKGYGAKVVLHGEVYDDCYQMALKMREESGLILIPAFDDEYIIAGQGTVGMEILEDLPDVDVVVVPAGGGGLLAGVALAVKAQRPEVKVVGVQAEGANAICMSFSCRLLTAAEEVHTIADGIAVKRPGGINFDLISQYVDRMVAVTDEEIAAAVLMLLERSKLVAEGAGAAALSALVSHKLDVTGCKCAVVISGGNIDVNVISRIIERGLIKTGRHLRLMVTVADKPGGLARLTNMMAGLGVNIVSIDHDRVVRRIPIGLALVILRVELLDSGQKDEVCAKLTAEGYDFEEID